MTRTRSDAVLSADGAYRYELRRTWAEEIPPVLWVMLNPSTADATDDDPTIRRCAGLSKRWGYGGIIVRNLFALRATHPAVLLGHPDPVGPDNDLWLTDDLLDHEKIICAWGVTGKIHDRAPAVVKMFRAAGVDLWALGFTMAGSPKHPLFVPNVTELEQWR